MKKTPYHFHKMVWLFFIASILGFVFESIYCFILHGYIESRSGLIYGPFSQIYGFAAVIVILLLQRTNFKNKWSLFFISAFIGCLYELICSLIQEYAFGFISWDYSYSMLDILGRTSLAYSFFWGILGVVFIKYIYPFISKRIENFPMKMSTLVTWIVILFMTFDLSISAAAVFRANQRYDGIPPTNSIQTFLDRSYPDSFIHQVYPNMVHVS
ncbi:MAG: putative ABC transporter permease [Dehalobacter sp. 4CP]|uniref:putative ABC transporter permease n=1 Tax=Dehalobacter sp. CP TaxID=2594474 RepID=UPI0013C69744|nr:putative ABC transporter permease [Dehalobacter sp. 4CP]